MGFVISTTSTIRMVRSFRLVLDCVLVERQCAGAGAILAGWPL
ncbi:hypothetical protein BIWAKO_06515 [Bosea sp. BIWAKO-01]|nr:hypothetical protein BIWAKO_06515 [Bosea sp. BIWAKO-01]